MNIPIDRLIKSAQYDLEQCVEIFPKLTANGRLRPDRAQERLADKRGIVDTLKAVQRFQAQGGTL